MMATLHVQIDEKHGEPTAYLIRNAYAHRNQLKQLGARWSPELQAWRVPFDVTIDDLLKMIPGLILTDDAAEWLTHYFQRVHHLKSLHFAQDALIKHGDGLDPYQRVGVRFLVDARRAILADDVGLGKTAQSIRAALEVEGKHVLVVVKKSLIYNWIVGIKDWANEDTFVLTTRNTLPHPLPRFVVTNYEVVVRRLEELRAQDFDVLIVDEAAAIKNRKAQRSKAMHRIAKDVPYVWLLTATPAQNSPDEIWSLLHCLYPERYSSYWRFVERHCKYEHNFFGGIDIYGVKDPKALAEELAPIMLRRDKSILNLPPLTFETVWVNLEGEQRRIYRDLRTKFLTVLDNERIVTAPSVVAQITRLRQVVCTPALIGGPDESAKTDALLELLEDLTPNHKVLVFTTFAEYVRNLLPKLQDFGVVSITGADSMTARAEAVQRFTSDPGRRVFIGTVQAAGEGLNLQVADVVIFMDKSWVPDENEIQAIGRAHRRGQKNPVHVISITAARTIDEYIEEVLKQKKTTTEAVRHIAQRLRREVG